ncbi:MAG TPA: hypothetical protein PK771_11865, partial [Spirochaetota bacterium]|nr:hypothetical protein [Spirochaetota bacterium]
LYPIYPYIEVVNNFSIYSNLASSTLETYTMIPVGLRNAGLLIGGRATYIDFIYPSLISGQGTTVRKSPYIYDTNFKWDWKPNNKIEWYINGFFGTDGMDLTRKYTYNFTKNGDEKYDLTEYDNSKYSYYHTIASTGFKITPNDKIIIDFLSGYEFFYGDVFRSTDAINKLTSPNISWNDKIYSTTNIKTKNNSIQSRFDMDINLTDKIIFSWGNLFIYDMKDDFYSITESKQTLTNYNYTNEFKNSNQLTSSVYFNFNFLIIPKKLEIETGCRLDHFIAIFSDKTLVTYPAIAPRFYLSYSPIKDFKYIEYLSLSLGSGLYSKNPSLSLYDSKNISDKFSIEPQQVFTNMTGLDLLFNFGLEIKIESFYKFYFNRNYAIYNDLISQYSDGYGHVTGVDFIIKQNVSKYIDGWISYSFNYTKFYNPNTDKKETMTNFNNYQILESEPTGQWFYPSYHRWHCFNIVINIKPINFLTISPSFGVASGIPKMIFNQTTYKYEYSDTERTLPSFPINLKISFNCYFPRTKLKFEGYIAVENFLLMPVLKGEAIYDSDRDVGRRDSGTDIFFPSVGIKLSY